MYAYLNKGNDTLGGDIIKPKDWKIGDLAAINDTTFFVIEQGATGVNVKRMIYKINIANATVITSGLYGGKTAEQLKDAAGLAAQSIVPVKKEVFMDLLDNGWPFDLDKAEGLAIIDDSTFAVCNDNDFGQYSPLENGIAYENLWLPYVFVYNLKGSNKLTNFVKRDANIIITEEESVMMQPEEIAVNIYPNPATDAITVTCNNANNALVQISTMSGSVVLSDIIVSNAINMNVSSIPSGIYTVTVISEGVRSNKLFVKK